MKVQLEQLGLNAIWVDFFDAEMLAAEQSHGEFSESLAKSCFGIERKDGVGYNFLSHNFVYAYMRRWRLPNALVLEDDATLQPPFTAARFKADLAAMMNEVPLTYSRYFVGGCGSIHSRQRKLGRYVAPTDKASRCANAYVTSLRGAREMMTHGLPSKLPIDHNMNAAVKRLKQLCPRCDNGMYFLEPDWMFKEGSKLGTTGQVKTEASHLKVNHS